MAVVYLRPVVDVTSYLTTTVIHPNYFPYAIVPTLHAARISIAFHAISRRTGNYPKLTWGMHIFGYLIMCWGGGVLSHVILGYPPPQLYNMHLWLNYCGVHLLMTFIFWMFPWALSLKSFDTVLFFPDAILRTGSIIQSVNLALNHPNKDLAKSFLPHILLGAIASAGGTQTAFMLSTFSADWCLSTPLFLRRGGWIATLDVWSGSLVAMIYCLLTVSHPYYQRLLLTLNAVDKDHLGPLLSPTGVRAVVTTVLSGLYALRMFINHWAPATRKRVTIDKKMQ